MKPLSEKYRYICISAFFAVYFYYMEIFTVLRSYRGILGWGALYTFGFSLVFGLCAGMVSSLFGKKTNKAISIIIASIAYIIFGTQTVYFTVFKTFTTLESAANAGDVLTSFWREALNGIWNSMIPLIILAVPFVLFIIFGSRITPEKRISFKSFILLLVVTVAIQLATMAGVVVNKSGVMSYSYVYDTFSPELSVPRFGVLTTLRIEIRDMLFRGTEIEEIAQEIPEIIQPEKPDQEKEDELPEPEIPEPEPVKYDNNVLEIDFDSLKAAETNKDILDMHEYFSKVTPTSQNEYTGMFKGKNLIWIVAEGFSSLAVDEVHTPTLYKLSHEGFIFNNFYNPVWGVSTSDGEYTTLTSLIPKSGVWSFKTSSKNYLPFAFGNMFSELGYSTRAYHDHTYTYYGRDLSHPNMGYDYKGYGNGLNVKKQWPESDVEMMELTVPEYINDEHFHTYYMTVSGHLEYNFMGNMMAYKHKAEVQDMLDAGYSEAASAYVSCQMEFDQSIEYLIKCLEEADVLKDTVIVISGDHYPYGLTHEQREELAGKELEENFEEYRTTLIIWNSKMESITVDKYCCSLDIMPTLANLFGLPYDSRLVMGRDIMSDAPALIVFNNRSYISDYGRYNSITDTFVPNEGVEVYDGYAVELLNKVNDMFAYSEKILDKDYYAKVLPEKAVGGNE